MTKKSVPRTKVPAAPTNFVQSAFEMLNSKRSNLKTAKFYGVAETLLVQGKVFSFKRFLTS